MKFDMYGVYMYRAPPRDCETLTWWWGLCGPMSHGAMLAVA
jgi:hypothetical protein